MIKQFDEIDEEAARQGYAIRSMRTMFNKSNHSGNTQRRIPKVFLATVGNRDRRACYK